MGRISRWNFNRKVFFDFSGTEHSATVRFYGYNDPGKISGPPENCYPPEGESLFEIMEIIGVDKTHPSYDMIHEEVSLAAQAEIDNGLEVD